MTILERLTADKDQIIADYVAGASTYKIAERYGCSNASIWQFLNSCDAPLRSKKPAIDVETITELRAQGLTFAQIDAKFGLGPNRSSTILRKSKIPKKPHASPVKDLLEANSDKILEDYANGVSLRSLAETHKVDRTSVRQFLVSYNVGVRGPIEYPVNKAFFDTIDNEAKAYALGFWFADGSNMSQRPLVSLDITDRDVLEMIAREMEYKGPIHIFPPRREGCLPIYAIRIWSRQLSDSLTRLGCVRNKTYLATFPDENLVPFDLTRHLIRGWLDGDGTICRDNRNDAWRSIIYGTEAACQGISNAVLKHLGFPCNLYSVRHPNSTCALWKATVAAQANLKRYLTWLYEDATIYLPRKRDKYLECVEHISRKLAA